MTVQEVLAKHRLVAAQLMQALTRNRELSAELISAHADRKQAVARAAHQRRVAVNARSKRDEWKRLCYWYERQLGIRGSDRKLS